jgi:AcrR family transcriptional regulator
VTDLETPTDTDSDEYAGDPRDARRADFVEATLVCLAEHGHQGTTVRRIAERAGVAPGLLTHYFAGKDALIAAAYQSLGDRFARHFDEQIASAGTDPKARLAAFVRASFRPPNLDPALLRIWVNFWSLVVNDPAVREIHAQNYADYRARVASLVSAVLAADDRDAAGPEVDALAIGISALLDGLWLELCLDPTVFDAVEGERIACEMIAARLGVRIA